MSQGESSHKLFAMVLPVTYRCNAKCAMCSLGRENREVISHAVIDEIIKGREILDELKVINVTGGEPFLLKNLPELVCSLAANLPSLETIGLSTNGLLTNRIINSLAAISEKLKGGKTKFAVEISLDGPPEIHDRTRGVKGAFEKATETFLSIKNSRLDPQFLSLGCNVNPITVDALGKTLKIADALGGYITFTPYIKSDLHFKNESEFFSFGKNGHYKQKAIAFFDSLLAARRIDSFYHKFVTTFIYSGKRNIGCVFRNNGVFIEPDGNVYVCAKDKDLFIGSLLKNSLGDILYSEKALRTRETMDSYCAACGSNCMVYQAGEMDI